jgi:Holliday junction resolvase-like predicted endonuclease
MDWDSCRALDRSSLGRLGEDWAVAFLKARGFPILNRNLVLDPGEIDILTEVDGERTVVEVRSTRAGRDVNWLPAQPFSAFDHQKALQVRRVALSHRCRRVDVITVRFHEHGIDLHWVPRAA